MTLNITICSGKMTLSISLSAVGNDTLNIIICSGGMTLSISLSAVVE